MKTVIIGAGSAFGSRLSIDILSREPIRDAEIALCDIDGKKVETVRAYVQSVIDHHKLPATVVASTDRRALLKDADFVVIAVAIGGPAYYGKPFEDEVLIPEKYGITQTVADTLGPGGIFRALRSGPALMEFARDVAELAPGAIILNYTNPMAMMTWALNAAYDGTAVGLCHGVQGTSKRMAMYIDKPYEEIAYWTAGINHMAWFLDFTWRGEDAYPLLREAMEDAETFEKDPVRFELFRRFGYFCTESTRHAAEYSPYFRHDPERMKGYQGTMAGRKESRAAWFEDMGVKAENAGSVELVRSHEYASGIMESVVTGELFCFNGNVMNHDLISSLPQGCCAEVPCMVDSLGVHPCRVGDLPAQCAALCRTNVNVQELTVKAIRERDKEAAYHAILLDPLTASQIPMDRARDMFEEMWEAEGDLLAYYK